MQEEVLDERAFVCYLQSILSKQGRPKTEIEFQNWSFEKTNSILGGNILLEVNGNCTGRWSQGFQLAIKTNWNYCKPHSGDIIK